jgi:hypothetical protein
MRQRPRKSRAYLGALDLMARSRAERGCNAGVIRGVIPAHIRDRLGLRGWNGVKPQYAPTIKRHIEGPIKWIRNAIEVCSHWVAR